MRPLQESALWRSRRGNLFCLALLLFLFFCSCMTPPRIPSIQETQLIENVPFYPQGKNQCGPASLASVLNYWGVALSPKEISDAIWSPGARGTLDLDMVMYARRKGFNARQYAGSVDDLIRSIQQKIPLIVLVDEGFWIYQRDHFMVVIGYRTEGPIVHSGTKARHPIPWSDFLRSWEKTKFWTLRINPP